MTMRCASQRGAKHDLANNKQQSAIKSQQSDMIKALLFDLDDTLLANSMDTFLPPYFGQLARQYPELDAATVVAATQQSVAQAVGRQDPLITLDRHFADAFTHQLGRPEAEWRARYAAFYARGFDVLQPLTGQRPEARDILSWALESGYRVVIATNALFPRAAIEARLRWAGLHDLALARVTVLEEWHFAKPNPAYFAEILADLGLRPDEALMIGNDPSDDIAPASSLGIPCWWITDDRLAEPPEGVAVVGQGPLETFGRWARECLSSLAPIPAPATALPDLLAGSLARLWAECQALQALDGRWNGRPGPDAWSANEIAVHLRDVEIEVNAPRVAWVLTQENPFIAGVDTDQWAIDRDYTVQDGQAALTTFAQARVATIARLREIAPEAYERTARHALFGRTSLRELVLVVLDHDQVHLRQLRTLSR